MQSFAKCSEYNLRTSAGYIFFVICIFFYDLYFLKKLVIHLMNYNTSQCNKRQIFLKYVINMSKYVNMGRIRDIVTKIGVVGALGFPYRV